MSSDNEEREKPQELVKLIFHKKTNHQVRGFMNKCINIQRFMQQLFDEESQAKRAAEIGQAILMAQSVRLTDIAAKMPGSREAGYKRIQRFLKATAPERCCGDDFKRKPSL